MKLRNKRGNQRCTLLYVVAVLASLLLLALLSTFWFKKVKRQGRPFKYFWTGHRKTDKQFPRWHPHFSCRKYKPVLRAEGVEFNSQRKLHSRVAGTHNTLLRSPSHGGVVLKPERLHSCEIMFLEWVSGAFNGSFGSEERKSNREEAVHNDEALHHLYEEFIPRYYGVLEEGQCLYRSRPCAVVQDISQSFVRASAVDIGVQARKFGPEAPVLKGLRSWQRSECQTFEVQFNELRDAWHTFSEEQALACLAAGFYDNAILLDVLQQVVPAVKRIAELITEQQHYIFADASILVLYETDGTAITKQGFRRVAVKLIDFDEVVPYWFILNLQSHTRQQKRGLSVIHQYLDQIVQQHSDITRSYLLDKCAVLEVVSHDPRLCR